MQPHAPELEEAVIGACLIEQEALPLIADKLRPEMFYDDHHQLIFAALMAMYHAGKKIDILTVKEELARRGNLDAIGGPYAIVQLSSKVASSAHIEYHAQIIHQKYLAREMVVGFNKLLTCAMDETIDIDDTLIDAHNLLDRLEGESGHNAHIRDMETLMADTMEEAERRIAKSVNGVTGIPTGLTELDKKTGGLQDNDLIIIAARPSVGKTAFALNIAANVALRGKKTVAVFSLEMSREQLMNRLFAAEGGIDSRKLLTGELSTEDWGKVADLSPIFGASSLYMDDTAGITVAEMKAKLRRVRDLGIVVIDYMQLMSSSRRSENRVQEVSEITRSLKIMAKELNVPVITLSQLSRGPDSRSDHRPMLSDLRESGSIEQDADIVLFLYREAYYEKEREDQSETECIVAKNRHGETGKIDLRWDGRYTRFFSVDRSRE